MYFSDSLNPKKRFERSGHTGGGADDLDGIDHAGLTGGEAAFVTRSYGNGYATSRHVYIAESTDAADGIETIVPVSITDPGTTPGRWKQTMPPICVNITPTTPFTGLVPMTVS